MQLRRPRKSSAVPKIMRQRARFEAAEGIIPPKMSAQIPITRPRISSGTIVCTVVFEVEKKSIIPKPDAGETDHGDRQVAIE